MIYKTLKDIAVENKNVVLRCDLNVPMKNQTITDDSRIKASLPSIRLLQEKKAKKITILSHFGRPKEGEISPSSSLNPVAKALASLLKTEVILAESIDEAKRIDAPIVLLENTRFFEGESTNLDSLATAFASLGELFIMDAFATIHRAHASTSGIAKKMKTAVIGPLVEKEIQALDRLLHQPKKPMIAIIGGAKVSSKLALLESLIPKVDIMIPGGGIANTFLAAQGLSLGKSLVEQNLLTTAVSLLEKAQNAKTQILLPIDGLCAKSLEENEQAEALDISKISEDMAIFDIGPKTQERYKKALEQASSILWNGPVGVFEHPLFEKGTISIAHKIAALDAFSLAGGGDTLAAINHAKVQGFSYLSTGGGAMLAYCEDEHQPGLQYIDLLEPNG